VKEPLLRNGRVQLILFALAIIAATIAADALGLSRWIGAIVGALASVLLGHVFPSLGGLPDPWDPDAPRTREPKEDHERPLTALDWVSIAFGLVGVLLVVGWVIRDELVAGIGAAALLVSGLIDIAQRLHERRRAVRQS
jgi:hypothetical protein